MGTGVGTLLTLSCDYRFQILAFPPLLSAVTIGCIVRCARDLFSFVDCRLLDVTTVHVNPKGSKAEDSRESKAKALAMAVWARSVGFRYS